MTVTTVAINCDVSLADDSEFSASQLDFTLSGPDYDTVSNDAIPAATISVALDADGLGTANLWPVDRGTRNTYYTVTVTGARTIGGKVVAQTLDLGRIAPPEDGAPHDLADLLAQSSGSIAVGSTIYATLADAVAAALAAQVLAEASAQSAGTAAIAAGAAIYPTAAAGIAAVADGALFYVPASGGGLTIYERDGASAVQVGTVALPDVPTLRDFGAVGDGVADDTDAITAAAASGKIVDGKGLTYKITSPGIVMASGSGFLNSTFDCSGITGGPGNDRALDTVFTATGTAGTAYALAADAARASGPDAYVEVASSVIAATFAPGDLVMLQSSEAWDASTNVGEYQMVRRVSGANIYLQHPLRYNYATANSATITKVAPVSGITFENVTATGTIADTLADESAKLGFFDGLYAKDVTFRGCKFNGWNRAAGVARWCWNTRVEACEFHDIYEYYGFLFANGSRFNWFHGNFGYNTRHMFSTGSSNTYGGGIMLDTYVTNNFASGRDASLDAHPGTDGIIFEGNTVEGSGEVSSAGGIFINCANAIIQNNHIRGYINVGVTVQPLFTNQTYAGSVVVSNNLIEILGGPASNTGVTVQTGTNGNTAVPSAITVSGNTINGAAGQGIYALHLSTALPLEHVNISGNTIVGATTGIQVRSNTAQGIEGGRIGNNLISEATTGIRLRADDASAFVRGVAVAGNTLVDGTTGIDFIGSATYSDNSVEPNLFHNVTAPVATAVRTHTIASGAITLRITSGLILVDTEGAAATDDLTTINGGVIGNEIRLRCANAARDVVVKHGTGVNGMRLSPTGDMTLGETRHNIGLACESGPRWSETGRESPL